MSVILVYGWGPCPLHGYTGTGPRLHLRILGLQPHTTRYVHVFAGLQAALYFLYFLYFNTFPIFPYIVFKCPIIPIFLTSLKEKSILSVIFALVDGAKAAVFLAQVNSP